MRGQHDLRQAFRLLGRSNIRRALWHAGGAADRIPDIGELNPGLREGQHDEAGDRRHDEDRGGDADANPEMAVAEGKEVARAHHCAPT
jgi:hypothetical protein